MNFDRDWVCLVKQKLEDTGIAIDEQFGRGTMPFERDVDQLIDDLRSMGLEGEINTGSYNRNGGVGSSFYLVYHGIDCDEAKRLAHDWANANLDT